MNPITSTMTGAEASPCPSVGRIKNNYFDGLPVTRTHKIVFGIIMLAFFFEQMNNANFSYIAPALMKSEHVTMDDIGRITFYYFIAMTIGGLLGGIISDFVGRRKTFLMSILLFTVASVLNGWTDNKLVFLIARSLTGFGIFSLMVCAQTYIAEMTPSESRGKWQGLVGAVGFCAMPFIGFVSRAIILMTPEAWRFIFYLGGLGFIALAIAYRYLPESPRWLVNHGRQSEAEAVVKRITGRDIDLSDVAKNTVPQGRAAEVLIGMLQPKYLRRTIVLFFLFVCFTPVGFTLFIWTGVMLQGKGISLDDSLLAMMLMQISLPIGGYISSKVSDKGGRKIPLIAMLLLSAAFLLIFGNASSYWVIVAAGCATQAFLTAEFFICFIYCSELYPTRMRNTASGFQNAASRLSTAAYQPVLPMIYASFCFPGVCTANAILLVIPALIVGIWGPRTGGKSLEEIS